MLGVAPLVGIVRTGVVGADEHATRLDPTWPPVLIFFVVAVIGAIAVMIVLFVRSVRAEAGNRARDSGDAR